MRKNKICLTKTIIRVCLLSLLSSSFLSADEKTLLGIDVLQRENFRPLKGSSIALITNQTGLDRKMISTVDILHKTKTVKLICIMTPEHGFRGVEKHGENIENSVDPKTGVPIYSLYGKNSRPTTEMLKGVNTIVFDIQDIGTRFYTYITTMGMALEEASKRHLRFYVLDRPNPIRGDIIEGDILDSDIKRMTGYFPIPVRHGLTPGEIALWMNATQKLNTNVQVIALENWRRNMWFENTSLIFTPPSPNMKSLTAALLYPGIGCFEATNVSVGRGSDQPFEIFGAPWINSRLLCARLREKNFAGVLFETTTFSPKDDLYVGEKCEGVRIVVTDRNKIRPFDIFLEAFLYLQETRPDQFQPNWEEIRVVTGSRGLKDVVDKKITLDEYRQQIKLKQEAFQTELQPFFLYK